MGDSQAEEAKDDDGHIALPKANEIWSDIINFRSYFNKKDFLTGLIFGLSPSAWDLGEDYQFAENLEEANLQYLSYLFISLPGIVYAVPLLKRFLDRCCPCAIAPMLGRIVTSTFALLLAGTVVAGVIFGIGVWSPKETPAVAVLALKILSIIVGVVLLSVKMLGVLVHTEKVKMINVRATNYEGVYESSFQFSLILYVWLHGQDLDVSAMASSLLMIAKSGAENFLTFGQENKLENRKFLGKLKLMGKMMPVFLLTAFFRIATLSVCAAWDNVPFIYVLLPAALIATLGSILDSQLS